MDGEPHPLGERPIPQFVLANSAYAADNSGPFIFQLKIRARACSRERPMRSIDIAKVESSKSPLFEKFFRLPISIYRGNAQWVPWFLGDMKTMADRRHPVFEHTEGEFFLAMEGKEALGRIFVFENSRYNKTHGMNSAHFYFLDLFESREAANALFEAAVGWARGRKLDKLIGPMGLGGVTGGGLLIDGFQHRAAMTMMMYNHPYYRPMVEDFGFTKFLDNFSFYLPGNAVLPPQIKEAADKLLEKGDFEVLHFKTKRDLARVAKDVTYVFMKTLSDHAGNYELSENELAFLEKGLMQIADPELIKVVAYRGQVVGFLFCFHDLSAAIQKSGGRITPLSIIRLLRESRKTDWMLINGVGVLPEYQGMGANALLYSEVEKTFRRHVKFKHLEMVQIQETTAKMLSNVKTLEGQVYKTHRMYEYPL